YESASAFENDSLSGFAMNMNTLFRFAISVRLLIAAHKLCELLSMLRHDLHHHRLLILARLETFLQFLRKILEERRIALDHVEELVLFSFGDALKLRLHRLLHQKFL